MGTLKLALLGSPEIRHDEKVLAFATRKTLALLIYLAVEGGVHSREKIAAFFWPESDTARSRGSLRLTLTYLREALEGEIPPTLGDGTDSSHLLVGRDTLGFNFNSPLDLDLDILNTSFKQIRASSKPEQNGTRHALLSQLQSTVDCYRSDFLDGFSLGDSLDFDNWVTLQREVWHRRIAAIFDFYSQALAMGGEIAQAIEVCTRWLTHDSANEAVYQRLMHLYLAEGNRDAARRTYKACQTMLAEQWHTRPSPETEALAERLHLVETQREAVPLGTITRTAAPHLPKAPLVGRVNEYSKLIEMYHATKSGQHLLAVVKGQAGIGKTRLASEFLGWARTQGADVLQGRAFEMAGQVPYQALVEALRSRLERENAPEDLLSDVWLAELSHLLPELRDRYPDLLPAVADEATSRIRLFEAITRLFEALAHKSREPVVLALDDLHWTDAASLEVLSYARRRWKESGTPVLLLVSLRSEMLLPASSLARWLTSVQHDLGATALTLDVLTFDDIVRLVQSLAGGGQTTALWLRSTPQREAFCRWLFAETGGQPFYVTEMLKALLERGLLHSSQRQDGSWIIDVEEVMDAIEQTSAHGLLPPSVREVINMRLMFLSNAARELLAAGAILGDGFRFEFLWRVSGLTEYDGLAALEEVLTSQLLREEQQEKIRALTRTYVFVHDKIRDVVYSETSDVRRHILHRRVVELLRDSDAPAAQLAHHALNAGLLEDAYHFSIIAGDEAARVFAYGGARIHYTQALECLAQLPDTEHNQSERVNLIIKYVSLSFSADAPERNIARLREAEALLHALPEVQKQAESGQMRLARLQYCLGRVHYYRNDRREALYSFRSALVIAQTAGDEELEAMASNVIARVLYHQGHFNEAIPLLAQSLLSLERAANWFEYITAVGYLGSARAACGEYQEGLKEAQRMLTLAIDMHHPTARAFCHLYLALTYFFGGERQHALEESLAMVSVAEQSGDHLAAYIGYGMSARAESQLGHHESARKSMARQQAIAEKLGERRLIIDDWFAAIKAEIEFNAGHIDEALALAEAAVFHARSSDGRYAEGLAQRIWFMSLARLSPSRWEEAQTHATASLQAFEASQALTEVARTRKYWGILCRDHQDEPAARAHLEQAAVMFVACGLENEAEETRTLLNALQK